MATRRARFVTLAKATEEIEKDRKKLGESDVAVVASALERSRDEPRGESEKVECQGVEMDKEAGGKLAGKVRALMVMWQHQEFRASVHLLGIGIALMLIFLLLQSGATFEVL